MGRRVVNGQTVLDYTAPAIGTWRAGQASTARDAALAAFGVTGTQRQALLRELVAAGEHGLTAHEAKERVGSIVSYPHVASTRMADMVPLGLVAQTEQTRPTPSGRQARVWVALPAGVEAVRAS